MKRYFVMIALLGLGFYGCMPINRFERNVQIPQNKWFYSFTPEISFDITDTTSLYNVFVNLRHTDAYAYRNIWLEIETRRPADSLFQKERFELNLQQPDGQWMGTGYADIWEVRHPLFSGIQFKRSGTYTVRLRQIMRDDPLAHVMNAGIRVEKINQ
ncbi:MAG: gliding motility lipoprotein GldH [Bacteroidetes bacterium]|nr:gliding motility lipoprotein GldH [Bacteroidota bacterium]